MPVYVFSDLIIAEAIETVRSRPILEYLDKVMGGWPILNPNWNADNFDLFKTLTAIRTHGNEPLFSVIPSQDLENPTVNILVLGEAFTYAGKIPCCANMTEFGHRSLIALFFQQKTFY